MLEKKKDKDNLIVFSLVSFLHNLEQKNIFLWEDWWYK